MKRTIRAGIALTVGASLAGVFAFTGTAIAAPGGNRPFGPQGTPGVSATPAVASASLAKDLQYMRDEERLARDVYTALAARYDGAQPFANIARAEQTHFEAMGNLLARYGVSDPSAGRAAGSYAEPELQGLYDRLMEQGSKSLADAYDVGIAIEKADIADLEKAIANASETDVDRVFGNLKRGSEMHLRAFEAAKAGTPMGQYDGAGYGTGPGYGAQAGNRAGDSNGMGMGKGLAPRNGQRFGGTGVCRVA